VNCVIIYKIFLLFLLCGSEVVVIACVSVGISVEALGGGSLPWWVDGHCMML